MSQPIPVMVRRYRCPHCTHSRASKAASVAHIGRCWENPENRACSTCSHYIPAGDGSQCIPGRDCDCNIYPPSCGSGIPIEEVSPNRPVTNCSAWRSWDDAPTKTIEGA